MNIKINADEEAIIKLALSDYTDKLVGTGSTYNTIVDILNKINAAGIFKVERTPNVLVRKRYMFQFEEGGWGEVIAKTLPGAKRQALLDYKDEDTLTVILDSIQLTDRLWIRNQVSPLY